MSPVINVASFRSCNRSLLSSNRFAERACMAECRSPRTSPRTASLNSFLSSQTFLDLSGPYIQFHSITIPASDREGFIAREGVAEVDVTTEPPLDADLLGVAGSQIPSFPCCVDIASCRRRLASVRGRRVFADNGSGGEVIAGSQHRLNQKCTPLSPSLSSMTSRWTWSLDLRLLFGTLQGEVSEVGFGSSLRCLK